jgi:hypothetical protein
MSEIQERPPPILNTLMVGPWEAMSETLGVPTTFLKDVDGGPTGRR